MYDIDKLSGCIKKGRIEKKLSQEELAEIIDITPTHIKHIESGHRKPSVEILFKLFNALDISFESLKENQSNESLLKTELINFINRCNESEVDLIYSLAKVVKSKDLF